MDDGPVLSVNKVADDAKMAIHNLGAFQLLEYQTDVQRCRFDKPSSLLRPYIADTSALPMLELSLMPVVTTMHRAIDHGPPTQGDHGREQARRRGFLNSGRSGRMQVGGLIAGMKRSDLIIIDDETR